MYVPRASVVNCILRAGLFLVYPNEKFSRSNGSYQNPAFYESGRISDLTRRQPVEVFQSE